MNDPYDLDDLDGEVEVIELDEDIEEGILDFGENEEGVISYISELEEGIDKNVPDLSTTTFSQHTKSVFQGILNCAGTIAVTGGEDDTAFVWSTHNCEVLFECTGHKDSVTQLVFNHDEQLLASGDMSGLVQVWDVVNKKLIWCYEGDDLEWLLWHPKANVLFAGYDSGNVFLWQIPQGNCKVLASRGVPSVCGHVLSDGLRLLTGYDNGQIRLWDIKTESVIWELEKNIPINGLTSMDVTKDDSLFIIAPSAHVFKVSDGSWVTTLLSANETDVEAVAFSNESGLVATGALSGAACIWDLKTNTLRHEAKIDAAITIIKWGSGDKLVFGSSNASIYVVDAKSGNLIQTLTGHKSHILSLSLSNDETSVLSTSDDVTAKIFTLKSNDI